MHGHFTGSTTGDSSTQLINADQNHTKDRFAQADASWKAGRTKGMDVTTIVTLSVFGAIVLFVLILIIF